MARRNGIDIKFKLPTDKELDRMFDAVPFLERYRVGDQVVRAGARPIVQRARQLAPRSTKAMRDKRSKSQQQKANWNIRLYRTIAFVVRKYGRGSATSVIGPKWPDGNKAYFNTSPRGRKQVLWGRVTGVTRPQIRNWIVQAFDETRPQQLAAMRKKLKQLIDQGFTRG